MSRERTGDERSPEDAPDWFDAEEDEGASAGSATGESDWLDDAETGGWFDDPERRPIDTGTAATDEPPDSVPGVAFDGESSVVDGAPETDEPADPTVEPTGSAEPMTEPTEPTESTDPTVEPAESTPEPPAERTPPEATGPPERTGPDSAVAADESGAGTDGEEPPEDAPTAADAPPGSDDGGRIEADDRSTDTSGRDGRATEAPDRRSTESPDETGDDGSYVHRVLAWLRSVVGRLS